MSYTLKRMRMLIAEPKTRMFIYDASPYVRRHCRSAILLWMRSVLRNRRLGCRWRKRGLVIDFNADRTPPEFGISTMWHEMCSEIGLYYHDTDPRRKILAQLCRRETSKDWKQSAERQRRWNGGISWSDCPLVQRTPGRLHGSLAMTSAPRVFVEGLIVNYEHGQSVEAIAEIFHGLDVDHVRQIIQYWLDRCGSIADGE